MPGAVRAIIAVLAGTILDLDGLARAQHVQGLDRPLDVNRHVLPMRQKIIIRTIDEIVPLITEVRAAAQRTAHALAELTTVGLDGVEILRRMKFTEMAWHPMVPRATAQPHRTNQSDLDHSCQSKGPSVSI